MATKQLRLVNDRKKLLQDPLGKIFCFISCFTRHLLFVSWTLDYYLNILKILWQKIFVILCIWPCATVVHKLWPMGQVWPSMSCQVARNIPGECQSYGAVLINWLWNLLGSAAINGHRLRLLELDNWHVSKRSFLLNLGKDINNIPMDDELETLRQRIRELEKQNAGLKLRVS